MTQLTKVQRLQIVVAWIKAGGKDNMPKETFIKRICEAKGIEYETIAE